MTDAPESKAEAPDTLTPAQRRRAAWRERHGFSPDCFCDTKLDGECPKHGAMIQSDRK